MQFKNYILIFSRLIVFGEWKFQSQFLLDVTIIMQFKNYILIFSRLSDFRKTYIDFYFTNLRYLASNTI